MDLCKTESDTFRLGQKIGKLLTDGSVLILTGSLGAGKTVFVKGIASALDIKERITSPTFTIVSEYSGTLPFYHIDLYRIDSIEEFELLGLDDVLGKIGIAAIEWGEKADEALPENAIVVHFTIHNSGEREVNIQGSEI